MKRVETRETDLDIKSVMLNDKREIYLNDDYGIEILMVFGGRTLHKILPSYPEGGYGGGSLYLSPCDSYLIFSYYSGQSQEAFNLYRISDKLEMVYEMPYICGEAASYGFSTDEKILIQGLPISCTADWWHPWRDEEMDEDENGNLFFDFGQINILDIEKKQVSQHMIRIFPSNDWNPQEDDFDPLMLPEMTSDDTLKVSMPWGDEILKFPLMNTIDFKVINDSFKAVFLG